MRVVLPLPQQKTSSPPSPESAPEIALTTIEDTSPETENTKSQSKFKSFSPTKRNLKGEIQKKEVQVSSKNRETSPVERKTPAASITCSGSAFSSPISTNSNFKTRSTSCTAKTTDYKISSSAKPLEARKKSSATSASSLHSSSSTSTFRKRKHIFSSGSIPAHKTHTHKTSVDQAKSHKASASFHSSTYTSKKLPRMTQGTPKNYASKNNKPDNSSKQLSFQNNNENAIFPENVENENNPALCSSHENHNNHQNENHNCANQDFNLQQQNHYHIESSETNNNNSNSKGLQDHRYQAFQKLLKARKLEMVEQEGDGNCLFRAVSLQVYGDSGMHGEVRRKCLDFMAKDETHFSQFIINEPFQNYIRRKRIDGVHGNNPEIQAISELFNRPVEVFVPENGAKPINIFHAEYKTSDTPIRLSYHDGNHYNAVIDPFCPTAGLGLGLPGLEPGLADKMQLKTAVKENLEVQEKKELEKVIEESMELQVKMAMMESAKYESNHIYNQKAISLSDLEATDFDLQQMVLANSLKSYQNSELVRKQSWPNRGTGVPKRRLKSNVPSTTSSSSSAVACRNSTSSACTPSTEINQHHATTTVVAPASATIPPSLSSQPAHASMDGEEEYPQVVQELVMNGFELSKVLHAYDLVGNNFDDLLAFLMSSGR